MNNLKDIHNSRVSRLYHLFVVILEQIDCKSTKKIGNMQIYSNIFCYFKKKLYLCSNKFEGYTQ